MAADSVKGGAKAFPRRDGRGTSQFAPVAGVAFAIFFRENTFTSQSVDAAAAAGHNTGMAQASEAPMVKLICGMISAEPAILDEAAGEMERRVGEIEAVSETWPFDFTEYYYEQMGRPLWRRFVSFAGLRAADGLAGVKVITNAIEAGFAARPGARVSRPVNLDPGYIEESKLVLASMKNFSHRIYLSQGVFAELTLMHRGVAWGALPWTFPDFASRRYDAFLSEVRGSLRAAKRSQA